MLIGEPAPCHFAALTPPQAFAGPASRRRGHGREAGPQQCKSIFFRNIKEPRVVSQPTLAHEDRPYPEGRGEAFSPVRPVFCQKLVLKPSGRNPCRHVQWKGNTNHHPEASTKSKHMKPKVLFCSYT